MGLSITTGVGAMDGRRMRRQNVWLTAFLIAPLALMVAVCWGIYAGLRYGAPMEAPPIGAGAGSTGGVNAIGELLAGHKANYAATQRREGDDQPTAQTRARGGGGDAGPPALVDPATLEQGFILIVTDKAKRANAGDPIYFASNVTGWNPGDGAYKLSPQSDMRWRIQLTKPKSKANPNEPVEFKFARGAWDKCEVAADLADIGNRQLPKVDVSRLKGDELPTIELSVEHWADERPGAESKAAGGPRPVLVSAGTLRRVQVQGAVGAAKGQDRDLLVWLPPGYDDPTNADKKYPVLYMHDGQNLFDKPATAPSEWRMDETSADLIAKAKIRPLIIVGIPHSGETRTAEYLPPVTDSEVLPGLKPQGEAHVEWLMREVMPRVERTFRVATGAENTGIGGSSLGGLISLYAGSRHPEVFGLVLAESPSLRMGKHEYWKALFGSVGAWPSKVYLGVGTTEAGSAPANAEANALYADAVKGLDALLVDKGMDDARLKFVIEADAVHSEDAWAKRLPGALEFLFPAH